MARVAIVTGGTRGIGEAISVALKDMGMTVAANYAGNEERAREFAVMRAFPDWSAVYADLGIRDTDGRLSFDDRARDAAIREAIMRAR